MKKAEFRTLIREEIRKVLNEEQGDFTLAGSDNDGMMDGIFLPLGQKPSKEMRAMILKRAQDEYGIDLAFMKNKATTEFSIYIPNAGDYANVMDLLKQLRVPNKG
jgi:hypothetical protein